MAPIHSHFMSQLTASSWMQHLNRLTLQKCLGSLTLWDLSNDQAIIQSTCQHLSTHSSHCSWVESNDFSPTVAHCDWNVHRAMNISLQQARTWPCAVQPQHTHFCFMCHLFFELGNIHTYTHTGFNPEYLCFYLWFTKWQTGKQKCSEVRQRYEMYVNTVIKP